jgi:uncharacterized C2H2 Zn-finger protein
MSAHQCPRCPLLFSYRTEVEAHLATDHAPKLVDAVRDTTATRELAEREERTAKKPAPA